MNTPCSNCGIPRPRDTDPTATGWRCYACGAYLGRRIQGLRARDSLDAARRDGGAGVVRDADGRRVYWA